MLFTGICIAQPVHLDTGATHVIVVRPIDTWGGNRASADYTLAGLRAKKVAFYYYDAEGNKVLGSGGLFKKAPQTPVVVQVQEGLAKWGFTNNGPSGMVFTVEQAVEIAPEKMQFLSKLQNDLYRRYVINQGNPETLPDRITAKKFLNVGIALAFFNTSMSRMGPVSGSQFAFSTGIADDIAKLTLNEKLALAAVPAPVFDYSPFKSIEVHRITFGSDRVGQIIIVYKDEKTAETQQTALAAAIVSASGADTTPEEVAVAREADFRNRMRIWSECQASGQCAHE